MMPSIAIGCDHAGFQYKEVLTAWLKENHYSIKDFGTYSTESTDYPDFAHAVASAVEKKEFDLGVLICGSDNGVAITANKHQGIRAAICWQDDLAELARGHNNANILCLPARYISVELATKIVDTFLRSPFEGGRHERRVNKISC